MAIRIEHIDGYGLYQNEINGIIRLHCRKNIIPVLLNPFNDSIDNKLFINEKYICCFKSITQLTERFNIDELRIILKNNYKIYDLKLKEYIIGRFILVFDPKDIISKNDISTYLINKLTSK